MANVRIEGTRIVSVATGLPVDISGIGTGHVEAGRPEEDVPVMAALGARSGRIPVRWCGAYGTGFQRDSLNDAYPRHIDPVYTAMIGRHVQVHRDHGLLVNIPMDSDYGQGTRGLGGWDFWSKDVREARQRRRQFTKLAGYIAGMFRPDFMEPIVEPRSALATREEVWQLQEEIIDEILSNSPGTLIILGGRIAYSPGYVTDFYSPQWATKYPNKIILTANFLDELVRDVWRHTMRLDQLAATAAKLGLPAHVQQFGSFYDKDPDSQHLRAFCSAMKSRGITGTPWEYMSIYRTYGIARLERPTDITSAHVIDPVRAEVIKEWLTQV